MFVYRMSVPSPNVAANVASTRRRGSAGRRASAASHAASWSASRSAARKHPTSSARGPAKTRTRAWSARRRARRSASSHRAQWAIRRGGVRAWFGSPSGFQPGRQGTGGERHLEPELRRAFVRARRFQREIGGGAKRVGAARAAALGLALAVHADRGQARKRLHDAADRVDIALVHLVGAVLVGLAAARHRVDHERERGPVRPQLAPEIRDQPRRGRHRLAPGRVGRQGGSGSGQGL